MVTLTSFRHRYWTIKEWRCLSCNEVWQLAMSPKYPKRYNWQPIHLCQEK